MAEETEALVSVPLAPSVTLGVHDLKVAALAVPGTAGAAVWLLRGPPDSPLLLALLYLAVATAFVAQAVLFVRAVKLLAREVHVARALDLLRERLAERPASGLKAKPSSAHPGLVRLLPEAPAGPAASVAVPLLSRERPRAERREVAREIPGGGAD